MFRRHTDYFRKLFSRAAEQQKRYGLQPLRVRLMNLGNHPLMFGNVFSLRALRG
jgi:hypothetical protein